MRKEKRTEVFTETEVEIEFRGRTRRLAPVWCEACGAQVEMVPPDVAAVVAGVSARAVFGWVEAGRVHFAETPEGALLVCLNSLPAADGSHGELQEAGGTRGDDAGALGDGRTEEGDDGRKSKASDDE